ncbi:MAG TPA: MarR family transcriptional regulator [Myxococcaceae bacterium]|jgi:DNA-binding MarR family transcriptional regulator
MANIRDVERLKELLLELGRTRPLRDPLSAGAELDLAGPQLHAMFWLGYDGPLTMGELARRLGVTEKGVTGLADRLETAGYCLRERDEKDRRVVRLQLTGMGHQFFKNAAARLDQRLSFVLGALPAADRDALFRILSRLGTYFAAISAPYAATPLSKHSSSRSKR